MGGGGGCCIGNFCSNCCVFQAIKKLFCSDSCCVGNHPIVQQGKGNENNVDIILRVQEALQSFTQDAEDRGEKFENAVIKESRESLDAFVDDLRKYNQIRYGNRRLNINISNIERENRKTEDKIHGFIVKRVKKRISQDDTECRELLEMEPNGEKTKKFNEFYQKILKEAVLELKDELKNSTEEQTDRVCDTIQRRIDSVVDVCESKAEEFDKIRKVKESDEAAVEQEQLRLTHFVAMCEYGLELLG